MRSASHSGTEAVFSPAGVTTRAEEVAEFEIQRNLGCFPFDRASPPDHSPTSQFENVIGFLRGFLLKNHLLRAHYLGFD